MKIDNDLKEEYEKFIKTEEGKKWIENTKKWMKDSDPDFGTYLYDFYPEMLQ